MFLLNKHVFSVVILMFYTLLCAYCAEKPYNVHTLEGPTKIERAYSSVLDINCFIGKPKSIMHLWKTVKLLLDIPSDRFSQYNGYTPEEVWNAYLADRSLFSSSFFSSKKSRSLRLDPFNTTCVAIKTDERYVIELNIQNVDYWKMGLLCAGVFLFIYSRSLGENVMFFYLSGITLGVFASFMILVYFLSKMLPGKPIVYGAMIGGWTLGVYALQLLWSNFQPLLLAYHTYVAGYVAASGFLSFVICYKMGPPRDKRNKNLITWTLQAAGLVLIYFSTEMTEAFAAISLGLIIIKCIPNSWIAGIKRYWRLKNPPKRVLLSQEEYYKQAQRETEKALEELRGYCSSPECPQWKLMLKLKNPQKFANFIETKTHLSDDEIEEHDNSDIIIRRKNISSQKSRERTVPSSQINGDNETSDDSSLSSDEWNARLVLPSSQINGDNETSDDSSLSSEEWNGIRY